MSKLVSVLLSYQTAVTTYFQDPEDQAYLQANMELSDEGYDYSSFCEQLFAR